MARLHLGRRLSAVAGVALLVLLALTGLATWVAHTVVRDQESRLLHERTSEVRLVLTSAVGSLTTTLSTLQGVLSTTTAATTAFAHITSPAVAGNPKLAFAILHPAAGGYRVAAAAGNGLRVGEMLAGSRAATARASTATNSKLPLSTPIIGKGPARLIGFALALPTEAPGSVLYEQIALGVLSAPREAASAPFHEVRVVLYASTDPDTSQILATTTRVLPLQGAVDRQSVPVGGSRWVVEVNAVTPLVGTVAAGAQWFVLGAGLLVSLLVALVIQSEARRRKAALALYESEHQVAATLQRSLLPALPELAGLDLAARYVVGGQGQQVGGDWFDVFDIDTDRVGIVIGDVIGHDIAAAAAMSQIRAALRAYAWEGADPAVVLGQLDRLINAFGFADMVTVFYGVLYPAGRDGSRLLRYANAGHLPPLVKNPEGDVRFLAEGRSVVIGAPINHLRAQAEDRLVAGSTLLLYTDGLVEVPGGSLDDSLRDLTATVTGKERAESADTLCERVVAAMPKGQSYDDIAILAVRLLGSELAPTDSDSSEGRLVTAG